MSQSNAPQMGYFRIELTGDKLDDLLGILRTHQTWGDVSSALRAADLFAIIEHQLTVARRELETRQ